MYEEGTSAREIARQLGCGRWALSHRLTEQGVSIRSQSDAGDLSRLTRGLEDDRARAARCVFPDCLDGADGGCRLCRRHVETVATAEGRGCPWPRCAQVRRWDVDRGAYAQLGCSYHESLGMGRLEAVRDR